MYIIHFGSMRKSYKADEWALVSLFGLLISYEGDLVCLILMVIRRLGKLECSYGGMFGYCWLCQQFG